jgi:steroid 5-alpha reductase family enzyme
MKILLFLITTPAYILMLVSHADSGKMNLPDIIFSRVLMGLVLIEFFADQQQWNYQQAKKRYQATAKLPVDSKYSAEDLDRGFVVSGLWSWSRHPNFAAEQAIWVVLYQWACYASDSLFNWTLTGAMGYLLLFQGSTWFTERISTGKYPEYKEYQRLVGRFIPKWLPRGGSVSEELSIADKPKDSRRKSGVKMS